MFVRLASGQNEPADDDRISLNGVVELRRLVDLAAARLDQNVQYDADELRGVVTLRLGGPLTDDELWSLTNHVLRARGFTTVTSRDGTFLSVVRAERASDLGRLERPGGIPPPGAPPGFVTLVAEVRHVPVAEAIETLKPVIGASPAQITSLGTSKRILISDARPRVERALEVLTLIDVARPEMTVERIDVRHLPAVTAAAAANDIVRTRETVIGRKGTGKCVAAPDGAGVLLVAPPEEVSLWRTALREIDRAPDRETRTYVPRHFPVAEVADLVRRLMETEGTDDRASLVEATSGPRIVVDNLTGALVVMGTTLEHARVEALLERLDGAPPDARRQTRSFSIRHRSAEDLVKLLQPLVDAQVVATGADGGGSTSDLGGASLSASLSTSALGGGPGASARGVLTLAFDRATNRILASGDPRQLEQVESLLGRLDVQPPQVLLEVLIVSLNEGQTQDLGVELRGRVRNGRTQAALSSLFGLGGPLATDIAVASPMGSGITGAVLSPGDFSVLLRAIQTVTEGHSLNMPRLLVNNHESGTFDAVLQQPFLATNASDTVATTSFGGTQDAGTSVSVTPQIAEGDQLVLDYTVTLSEFLGESADPSLPPPRQQNSLGSVVTIPDGYTVVLGGLEVETEADGETRVPILGDLPLFGWLFRSSSATRTRTRFWVFLRASVMRHPRFEDLRFLSDAQRTDAGLDPDLPPVEPRIVR